LTILGKRTDLHIHKLLAVAFLGHIPSGHDIVVDHINNNPLDNKISNLQLITQRENLTKDRRGRRSKYAGVNWDRKQKKWKARITINGKCKNNGVLIDEDHIGEAYSHVCV